MNYTPLPIILAKDHEDELSLLYNDMQTELDWAHGILGVISIILVYVYKADIYRGILAAIQAAPGLVNYIKEVIWNIWQLWSKWV